MTVAAAGAGVGVATLPSASDPLEVGRLTRPERAGARVLRLAHGRLTLDELVSGAWAALDAGFPAACPICDGPMTGRRPNVPDSVLAGSRAEHATPTASSSATPGHSPGAGFGCRECGSELS